MRAVLRTGARALALVAAALTVGTVVAGPATAAGGHAVPMVGVHDADITLTPTSIGYVQPGGLWVTRGQFTFDIDVTNSGSSDEAGVEVALRIPSAWDVQVGADGWNCQDIDATTVGCVSTIPVASGDAWPTLNAEVFPSDPTFNGFVDVGARPGLNGIPAPGENELDQSVYYDTSI